MATVTARLAVATLALAAALALPVPASASLGGREDVDVAVPPRDGKLLGMHSYLSWFMDERFRAPRYAGAPFLSADREAWYIRKMGGRAHRWIVSWDHVQPEEGAPPYPPYAAAPEERIATWTALHDRQYAAALRHGLRPIIVIQDAPEWAAPLQGRTVRFAAATQLAAWEAFAHATARRYPEAHIEIWNEPNQVDGQRPELDPPTMAELVVRAARGVRAARNPGQLVIGPGLLWRNSNAEVKSASQYLDGLIAAGMRDGVVDGLGVHPYAEEGRTDFAAPGRRFEREFAELRAVVRARGVRAPFWVTETGSTTSAPRRTITPAQQCDVNRRLYNRLASMDDVQAVVFHTLRERPAPSFTLHGDKPAEFGFGWLTEGLRAKPVWRYFARRAAGRRTAGCPGA